MRIPTRFGLCVALAIFALAGGAVSSALADNHPFLFSFGAFSNPNGIAVDQTNGNVYVADIGTGTVQKFDANGNPVDFSALGSNTLNGATTPAGSFSFPTSPANPAAIAVDDSTSPSDPSAGDLYVMDVGHNVIDKFSASGVYLNQIGPFSGSGPLGLGIEADGMLRVDLGGVADIDLFDNSAANNFISLLFTSSTAYLFPGEMQPESGFAVSPTGDGYGLYSSCRCIERGGQKIEEFGRVDSGSTGVAVAVDKATGHVYVDDESSVAEWDPGEMNGRHVFPGGFEEVTQGTFVSSFGSLQLSPSGQGGIALNGANGNVYVSNPTDGKVYVFGNDVPAVAAGPAVNASKTSATLEGAVDPRGVAVSSCLFEYGSDGSYGQSVPCDQTPAQIGSGTSPATVKADISGLQPGLLYHFRLTAANATGVGSSSGLFATAGPGFGVKTFEVSFQNEDGTPDTQAGSHPFEMVTNIAFNTTFKRREVNADSRYVTQPDGNVKDVITDLPPGLVGDPNATATKCTLRQLEGEKGDISGGGACPAGSQVGELEVLFGDQPGGLPPLREPVFNMVPPHGVAVQLGGNFIIPKAFINAGVQAGGDYPVRAASLDVPVIEPILTTRLTVFGVVGSGPTRKAFLTLPTGCTGPLRSKISVDSYQSPGHFVEAGTLTHDAVGAPVALTGCSKLRFPPTITVSPDVPDASASTGLTVGVHVSQKAALNPDGLAESALRNTTVTLPEGVAINPAGADGLEACSEGLVGFTGFEEFNSEFEPGSQTATFTPEMPEPVLPGANFCPNGSKIGTVKVNTPLLANPLEGAVYLASQNANPFGSLVAMYIIAEDPASGSLIKLTGEVRLTETGQIVTTFKNTPDLPFEDLELHFFGGERAPLTTPSRCGTYTTNATFVPWDGNGPVNTSSSFQIDHGPNGGPCPGQSLPFNPSLTAGTTNINAGAFSPFTMTMSRDDGNQNLQAISLNMPPGLSGLLSGVKLCGEAEANAGTCGPESEIGETTVSVGVGGSPFSVKGGKVYITGPYKGAPFGLSIVNPAKAGPYDLGKVIVRAKIEVDPITAALTITSDNSGPYKIPTILDGIPLQIKHVNVTINRPGFTFNPTNCNPTSITGSLSSSEGATQALSVPFQATNCGALAFAPKFAVTTSGKTSKALGASLTATVSEPAGSMGTQANIGLVKVELPTQLPSRLTTLQKACLASVFNVNPAGCPSASVIGHAKVITPLLPVPLEGPAIFVSHGGEAFPSLTIVLQGYGVTVDLVGSTFISKAGITSTTFKTVPDTPFSTFTLTLPEGPFSALAANGNLCTSKLVMPTEFIAQNGARLKQSTPISTAGCGQGIAITKKKLMGNSVSVTVATTVKGLVTITGAGLRKTSKTMAAGYRTFKIPLTAKGRAARKHRRKIQIKASLKVGKKTVSKTARLKP